MVVSRYFVDEAGDLSLFDRRGRSLLGQEGVSKCFIVGAALVRDPDTLSDKLTALRERLLSDPYFAEVPSMSRAARKTARLFHAKDDTPEVRAEVFRLLHEQESIGLYCAFRRKRVLEIDARRRFELTGEKLNIDAIYDGLITSIFQDRLHLSEENHIVFARRGKADRNLALTGAIAHAKEKFEARWGKGIDRPCYVSSSTPSETTALQITDYYLWALQRLLERGEPRYFNYLAPAYRLIVDRDDDRRTRYGEYYSPKRNPLSVEKLMPVT